MREKRPVRVYTLGKRRIVIITIIATLIIIISPSVIMIVTLVITLDLIIISSLTLRTIGVIITPLMKTWTGIAA